jgi:hypothetical protein
MQEVEHSIAKGESQNKFSRKLWKKRLLAIYRHIWDDNIKIVSEVVDTEWSGTGQQPMAISCEDSKETRVQWKAGNFLKIWSIVCFWKIALIYKFQLRRFDF